MNRYRIIIPGMILSFISATASAFTAGEYWEVTMKMEMKGMPFSMPPQVIKVCSPKGEAMDPRKGNEDQGCQFSDYKASNKKVTYRFSCSNRRESMSGDAEYTLGIDQYDGVMHMQGTSDGQPMTMTQRTHGKRVGGSCDPDQLKHERDKNRQEAEAEHARECNTTGYTTLMWIENSSKFTDNNWLCPRENQQKTMCAAINKDVSHDIAVFLKMVDQKNLIRTCNVNMAGATKSICNQLNEKNYYQLMPHCPAEAKALEEAFREAALRKECEGREYTAETRNEDFSNCINGIEPPESTDGAPAKKPRKKSVNGGDAAGTVGGTTPVSPQPAPNPPQNDGTTELLNNAIKLKGLLGF